jgi:sugar lactone lactonase YvrE
LAFWVDGKLSKIFERTDGEKLLKGAETIIFSSNGTMFTLTEQANLVKLSDFETLHEAANGKPKIITAATTLVATLGNGRPLGGCFTPDDSYLYMADAVLGLTRIKNPGDPKSKVEIVATSVMDNGTRTRIFYPDDVVVGPKTGKVYFTDGK